MPSQAHNIYHVGFFVLIFLTIVPPSRASVQEKSVFEEEALAARSLHEHNRMRDEHNRMRDEHYPRVFYPAGSPWVETAAERATHLLIIQNQPKVALLPAPQLPQRPLPSRANILALAKNERAALYENIGPMHPVLIALSKFDKKRANSIPQSAGACIDRFELEAIAQKNHITVEALRQRLGIPPEAESILLTTRKGVSAVGTEIALLEQLLLLLEGGAGTKKAALRRDAQYQEVRQIANRFRLFLFYQRLWDFHFRAAPTFWSETVRLWLTSKYKNHPHLNANEHMRAIFETLLHDMDNDPNFDMYFFNGIGDSRHRALKRYIRQFLKTERFSAYKPLFPNWKDVLSKPQPDSNEPSHEPKESLLWRILSTLAEWFSVPPTYITPPAQHKSLSKAS